MKKLMSLLLALTVLLTALSACASEQAADGADAGGASAEISDLTKDLVPLAASPQQAQDCSAVMDFALEMLCDAAGEENALFSPLSAYLALAMAANGSAGETRTQFEAVLGGSLSQINNRCAWLGTQLTGLTGSTNLQLANSAWIDDDFSVSEDFVRNVTDWYDAGIFSADLPTQTAVDAMNNWVSEKTNGEIETMFDEIPNSNAAVILLNALYLDARWQTPFAPEDTFTGEFSCRSGDTVACEYLRDSGSQRPYIQGSGYEGVILPYDDGRLAMAAILPTDGQTVEEMAELLDTEQLLTALENAQSCRMGLQLPKFKVASELDLNAPLEKAGLESAFNDRADFSELTENTSQELYISKVSQKCTLTVGEKGTTAAGATSVEIAEKTAMIEEVSLCFNRPFIYMVYDTVSGVPLFLGTVTNPLS